MRQRPTSQPFLFPGPGEIPHSSRTSGCFATELRLKACLFSQVSPPCQTKTWRQGTFAICPYAILWSSPKGHGETASHPATPNPAVSFSRCAAESALVQAISCLDCSHSIFSLIGPLGSESQLSIVRSRLPADDLRTTGASYLFFATQSEVICFAPFGDSPVWAMVSLPPLALPSSVLPSHYASRFAQRWHLKAP